MYNNFIRSFARRHTAISLDEVTWLFRPQTGKWALLELFRSSIRMYWRTAMLPFYSCGKAHVSATNPELFRSLSGAEHDAPWSRHVGAVGRHIVMPPTPNSSARCRVFIWAPKAQRMMGKIQLTHCEGWFWYKGACIKQTSQRLSITVQTSSKDVNKSVVIKQFPSLKTLY